jgi:hypothetical protein
MEKYDRYGTALIVEAYGPGRGLADVEQPIPGGWKAVDDLEVEELFKPRLQTFNIPTKLAFSALLRVGGNPKMYVRGVPDSEGSIVDSIKSPTSLTTLAKDVKTVTMEGHPPHSFRVYITGPAPDEFKKLVKNAHTLWLEHEKKPEVTTLEKVQRVLDQYVRTKMSRPVINCWIEFAVETEEGARPSGHTNTKFSYVQTGYSVAAHAGGYAAQTPSEEEQRWLTTQDRKELKNIGNVDKLANAVLNRYYHDVWKVFKRYVYDDPYGVVHTIHHELKKGEVRIAYDKTKGKPVPTSATTPEKKYDPSEPHKNPVLYPASSGTVYDAVTKRRTPLTHPHQGYVTSTNPRPRSGVVASIRQTAGDVGNMLISADPKDRVVQHADGSFTRPDPLPPLVGKMVPESPVKPLVDTEKYKAIFGIYYDHPMIVPKLSRQVYWYGSREQFFRAVFEYAVMTGDRPVLAYHIFGKKGNRANISISRKELELDGSIEGRRAQEAIDKTIEAFHREVKRGVALWPAKIAKWLGVSVDLSQNDIPVNPLRDMPKGKKIDPEGWTKYRNYIRNQSRQVLGLNFQAQLAKKYINPTLGQKERYKFSRHEIPARVGLATTVKYTGERDKQGRPVEPWGVYLVEYLLAHKTLGMHGSTYMIPLNIVRANEDIPPRGTLKRWSQAEYMTLMREKFPKYNLHTLSNWRFLRARTDHHFPFSRLIRVSVALEEDLPKINAQLSQRGVRNIQRTTFGYKIDGIEWDAYQMVVAMPPSVAEKEFGLIHRAAYSRLILDEPRIVEQLRRGVKGNRRSLVAFGLSPVAMSSEFLTSPWSKADPKSIDPNDFGPTMTILPPGYFQSKIGQQWVPKVHEHLNEAGEVVARAIVGYEHANNPEERMDTWLKYAKKIVEKTNEVEYDIRHYLRALANVKMEQRSRLGQELDQNLELYIKYVKREVTPTGGSYTIPVVMYRIGLATYQAPVGSSKVRTDWLTIKAPSESVAQLLILYRLLRRSAANKQLGNAMKIRSAGGKFRIFPDMNARLLAQWAKANFIVIRQDEPKGIRRIAPRIRFDRKDLDRGAIDSHHLLAKLLRID